MLSEELQNRIDRLDNIKKPGTDTIERGRIETVLIDTEKKEFPSEWLEKVEHPEVLDAFVEALTKIPSIRRKLIMSSVIKLAKNWFIERIQEPSSYRGLVVVASSVGITLSPESATQILIIAGGIVGLIEIIKDEKKETEV